MVSFRYLVYFIKIRNYLNVHKFIIVIIRLATFKACQRLPKTLLMQILCTSLSFIFPNSPIRIDLFLMTNTDDEKSDDLNDPIIKFYNNHLAGVSHSHLTTIVSESDIINNNAKFVDHPASDLGTCAMQHA